MADVKFIVSVEDAGAIRKLTETERALYDLQNTTKKAGSAFGNLWKDMALGQAAWDLTRRGVGLIKTELIDSLKQAADYEKALKGLNSAFEISGRTMPGMVNHLQRYASELEKLGLDEDDAILKAESLLLQLTNLDEKGVKVATRGAIGLSSVFGMDLASAAETVAKGMEGNYMMLQRLIPAIRNATTEEGKRAAMMKTFEDLYKRAIADTGTYAGQIKQLGLEWKNAKQELGDAVLSTGILQESMHGLTVIMKGLTGQTGREYRASMTDQIAANNAAGESLKKMAEALGWNRTELPALREQYNLNSVQLLSWVKDNMLGAKAATALNLVLDEEAAALAKSKEGFTETGLAVKSAATLFGEYTAQFLNMRQKVLEPIAFTLLETPLPPPKTNAYQAWLETQRAFAKEATSEVKDFYEGSHDYSAEFYQDITRGFTAAFMKFKLTTQGFADFFIATWQAIKQAFFQILADMLARWLTMAFVKGILNLLTGGVGGSFFGAGSAGSIGFAKGFEGVVSRPTPMIVGEAGPEYVSVRPMNKPGGGGGGGGTTNVNIYVSTIDAERFDSVVRYRIAPVLKEIYAHGGL